MTNVNSLGLTQTAAICSSGYQYPTPIATAYTEEWDGSSWTEVGDLNTARASFKCFGTNTSALATGGYTSTQVGVVESWNGSTWPEVRAVNTARRTASGTKGSNTSALAFAGIGNPSNFFELLKENYIDLLKTYSFPDHHNYSKSSIFSFSFS